MLTPDVLNLTRMLDAQRMNGAQPPCPDCNDEGKVCTHEGDVIGPCPTCSPVPCLACREAPAEPDSKFCLTCDCERRF